MAISKFVPKAWIRNYTPTECRENVKFYIFMCFWGYFSMKKQSKIANLPKLDNTFCITGPL